TEVFTVVTQPVNGTLVFNPDGSYTYTPNTDFVGEDTFTYQICDGGSPQACDTASVTIQVLPEGGPDNAAPVANDDTSITEAGIPVSGNVIVNDFDPDGDIITVTGNTTPNNGTVVVNPDGSFTYTPNPGFTGEDTFDYTICDSGTPSLCSTATVTIEVIGDAGNTTVANDDAYFGFIETVITGNVLTNDSDPEGDSFSVSSNTAASNGTVVLDADGSLTYTPNGTYSGTDQFTYTITDAAGATATATVYISIDPSPNGGNTILAVNDINDTFVNQPVSGNVGTNDQNPDGPAGTEVFTVVTQPVNGTLVFNPDGSYTYTPNTDFIGEDTFTYQICDGGSPQACDTASVTIQVLPEGGPDNAAPVANDDTSITEAGIPVSGNVIVNDFDPDGDTITVTGNTTPNNGTVVVNPDGSFTYTPNPGFTGEDTFDYTICDSGIPSLCSTATVTIEVIGDAGNTTVANDDAYFGFIETVITGNVLTNDSDPEGDSFSVSSNTAASNGTVVLDADGSLTYTPNGTYSGTDQFTYTITDAAGATATATVYISIDPSPNGGNEILAVNDINDTFVNQPVSGNVGTNDQNPDGPAGTEVFTVVTQPVNGTLVFNPDGSYTYTPNTNFVGEDTFTYQICDGGSPQACDTASVYLEVVPLETTQNDPPVANADTNTTEVGVSINGNVIVNDFDPDGDTITVTGNTTPNNGTAVVNPDGTYTYTPNPGFTGEDSFEYTICDNGTPQACDTAIVVIQVVPDSGNITNANDDVYFAEINSGISGNVLDNDTDPEGQTQTVDVALSPANGPANGTLVINPDGTFEYTPNTDFAGTDQFTYSIFDAGSPVATDIATVYILISEKPNPEITLVKTGLFNDENADTFAQVGETITYTFTVTNTGNTPVNAIAIDDAFLSINGLSIAPANLLPGEVGTVTASYEITQTDIETGFVTNSALATGTDPYNEEVTDTSDNGDETVDEDGDGDPTNDPTITNTPGLSALSVYKFGTWNDEDGDQLPEVGETITYTFTVRNTGQTAIFDIVIDDPLVTVTGGPIDLAIGAVDTDTFSAIYVITQSDIENAGVKNQAIGSGVLSNGTVIEDISDNGDDEEESTFDTDDIDGDPTNDPTFTRLDGVLPIEDIIVYNVMTPNGDGLNDVFMIQNITSFPNNTVQIFNRWGVEVFSTKGYDPNSDNAFRGFSDGRATVRRGERLPTGTYYYIITYERDGGEIRKLASFLYIN
ncbi:Ig-like domain-containing protein, partial [Leeuwenhoekiella aequorea]